MADFTEVMKHARRLCTEYHKGSCAYCPIGKTGGNSNEIACIFINCSNKVDFEKAQQSIIAWAVEHPEPIYPSWNEAWGKLFPKNEAQESPCPRFFMSKEEYSKLCRSNATCNDCLSKPMSAEVAKNLEIKPIKHAHSITADEDSTKYY